MNHNITKLAAIAGIVLLTCAFFTYVTLGLLVQAMFTDVTPWNTIANATGCNPGEGYAIWIFSCILMCCTYAASLDIVWDLQRAIKDKAENAVREDARLALIAVEVRKGDVGARVHAIYSTMTANAARIEAELRSFTPNKNEIMNALRCIEDAENDYINYLNDPETRPLSTDAERDAINEARNIYRFITHTRFVRNLTAKAYHEGHYFNA